MSTTRQELVGKIQTVLGPIAPQQLGRTLMHEHVLCDIRAPQSRADNDLGPEITLENVWQLNYGRGIKRAGRKYMLDLEDIATREVRMMKHDGGDAIVELTCGGLSPDPAGLKRIAAGTGVHLIMGCGHYVNDYQDPQEPPAHGRGFRRRDDRPDPAWRLGHRGARRHDRRDRLQRAVDRDREARHAGRSDRRGRDRAPRSTSIPAAIPTSRRKSPTSSRRPAIRPSGSSSATSTAPSSTRRGCCKLADSGVTIEFDLFGQESSYYGLSDIDMPNDATRLRLIRALIEHGHLDRVVISHDICYRTRLASFGGHGYGHIFRNVVPMMGKRGYSEDEIDAILVRNPRRLLTFV